MLEGGHADAREVDLALFGGPVVRQRVGGVLLTWDLLLDDSPGTRALLHPQLLRREVLQLAAPLSRCNAAGATAI